MRKDALAKVSHYSPSVRREALHSLQSLLEKFPARQAAPAALLATIEKVAPRAADEDRGVRTALFGLLSALAEIVTPARLAPYFPLLLVHTCSAMTKLDSGVRLDSLHLVDLWLEHFPQLVVRYGARLLHNFLHLVSSEVGGSGKASGSKGARAPAGRTLSTNPMSRLSTMQGRMAVLRRLLIFMELALKSSQQGLVQATKAGGSAQASRTLSKAGNAVKPTSVEIAAEDDAHKAAMLAIPDAVFATGPCAATFAAAGDAPTGGHVDLSAMTSGGSGAGHDSADANQLAPATLLKFVSHDLLPVLVSGAVGGLWHGMVALG